MNQLKEKKDKRPITSCLGIAYPMPKDNYKGISKKTIKKAVKKAVKEYGKVFKWLK